MFVQNNRKHISKPVVNNGLFIVGPSFSGKTYRWMKKLKNVTNGDLDIKSRYIAPYEEFVIKNEVLDNDDYKGGFVISMLSIM